MFYFVTLLIFDFLYLFVAFLFNLFFAQGCLCRELADPSLPKC